MDISRPCQPEKLIPLLPWPGFDPSFSGHNDRRAIISEWTRLRLRLLSHRGWQEDFRVDSQATHMNCWPMGLTFDSQKWVSLLTTMIGVSVYGDVMVNRIIWYFHLKVRQLGRPKSPANRFRSQHSPLYPLPSIYLYPQPQPLPRSFSSENWFCFYKNTRPIIFI